MTHKTVVVDIERFLNCYNRVKPEIKKENKKLNIFFTILYSFLAFPYLNFQFPYCEFFPILVCFTLRYMF